MWPLHHGCRRGCPRRQYVSTRPITRCSLQGPPTSSSSKLSTAATTCLIAVARRCAMHARAAACAVRRIHIPMHPIHTAYLWLGGSGRTLSSPDHAALDCYARTLANPTRRTHNIGGGQDCRNWRRGAVQVWRQHVRGDRPAKWPLCRAAVLQESLGPQGAVHYRPRARTELRPRSCAESPPPIFGRW